MLSLADATGLNRAKARWNTKMQSEEICGPCPFPGCSASDAFHVYPDRNIIPGIGPLGWYICMDSTRGGRAGCGKSGDLITYVQEIENVSFDDACKQLEIDPQVILIYRKSEKVRQLEAEGVTFADACRRVQADPSAITQYRESEVIPEAPARGYYASSTPLAERSDLWRTNAFALARMASRSMTSQVMEYLAGRDMPLQVVRAAGLGLYDQYKWVDAELWGEKTAKDSKKKRMLIPRGIVIPWVDNNYRVSCIRFRRLPWDTSEEARQWYGEEKGGEIGRYKALYGVSSRTFYNGHKITPGCKVALFEGEFTSVVAQAAVIDPSVVCVATGSTGWCFNDDNIRLLAMCDQVLICFDADKNSAGDKAAQRWLDALDNARRWRPLWNDANDMAMDGVDVGEWLMLGFEGPGQEAAVVELASAAVSPEASTENKKDLDSFYNPVPAVAEISTEPEVLASVPTRCQVCGADMEEAATAFPGLDFHYSEDGQVVWCAIHWPPAVAARQRQVQVEFELAEIERKEEVAMWYRRGGYPVPVPQLGPDGFYIVPMPEEIKALIRGKKVAELPRCAGGCDRMPTEQDASGRYCDRCWDRRQGILADAMTAGAAIDWASVEYLKGGFTGEGQAAWRGKLEALGDVTLHMVAGAARRHHQAQPVPLKTAARKLA